MNRALLLSLALHGLLLTFLVSYGLVIESEQGEISDKVIHASLFKRHRSEDHSFQKLEQSIKPEILKAVPPSVMKSTLVASQTMRANQEPVSDTNTPIEASVSQQEIVGQTKDVSGKEAAKTEISQDGIRQYRLNLAREARNYRRFPALARQRGWEGEVSVVVGTVAGVVVPQVSLNQGSGIPVLDSAAIEMVRLAVGSAVLPETLRGRAFALTLPIRFTLED